MSYENATEMELLRQIAQDVKAIRERLELESSEPSPAMREWRAAFDQWKAAT